MSLQNKGPQSGESKPGESKPGVLYVVATPIGNLDDITARARTVLSSVAAIAAEDTRHAAKLLNHLGVKTPLLAFHDHNEREITDTLLARIERGEAIALVSDAGTPLISDPGFHLVRAAHRRALRVVPVPGPSALIAALSAAGLPTDRFVFEGFLSSKTAARRQRLEELVEESRTLVFYESCHRIVDSLQDMADILGIDRMAVIARELTKTFETIRQGPLAELLLFLKGDSNQRKGEFVVLIQGKPADQTDSIDSDTLKVLKVLLGELPLKQAAALAAKITGAPKNQLYDAGLVIKEKQ